MQFLAQLVNSGNSVFFAVKVTSRVGLVIKRYASVPLVLFPCDALYARLAVKPHAAVHAILRMGGAAQIFNAIVQHVAVDVVNERDWLVAVVRPHKTMYGVELVHDFDSAVTIAVDGTSGSISAFVWTDLLPEKLAVSVVK